MRVLFFETAWKFDYVRVSVCLEKECDHLDNDFTTYSFGLAGAFSKK